MRMAPRTTRKMSGISQCRNSCPGTGMTLGRNGPGNPRIARTSFLGAPRAADRWTSGASTPAAPGNPLGATEELRVNHGGTWAAYHRPRMPIEVRPLAKGRFDDLVQLFGRPGASI